MTFGQAIASACLAWLVMASLVRFISTRKPRAQLAGPCCGTCGYSVVGLTKMTCPECGSDLRRVGIEISRSARRRPWRLIGPVVSLSLAILFSASATVPLMTELLPQRQYHSVTASFSGPRSKMYQSIRIQGAKGQFAAARTMLLLTVDLKPLSGKSIPLKIESAGSSASNNIEMVESLGAFDVHSILKWMAANGIDVSQSNVIDEARSVAASVRESVWAYPPDSDTGGSWTARTYDPHFISSSVSRTDLLQSIPRRSEILVVFWAILWAIGIWYILWPRRRMNAPMMEP